MLLTADQQIEVLALVVSLEALEAPHLLLLVCKELRLDAAEVMSTLTARGDLSWIEVTSLLHKFPKAKHLSFSPISSHLTFSQALITELVKGRELHTLRLSMCIGVTDLSVLAGCASLHTLNLSSCFRVTDVSALAGCASLHTLDLTRCSGVTDLSVLAGRASLQIISDEELEGEYEEDA